MYIAVIRVQAGRGTKRLKGRALKGAKCHKDLSVLRSVDGLHPLVL